MELLLVRHGLAGKADPAQWPDDDLRPLTAKGRKAFKQAARGLRRQGPAPIRILTSPVLRARETAALLAKAFGLEPSAVVIIPELHHERLPGRALPALAEKKLPRAFALVGHEPWLGEFLSLLIAGNETAQIGFAKGGAALVSAPSLAKGQATLAWLLTQDQLAALA